MEFKNPYHLRKLIPRFRLINWFRADRLRLRRSYT